MPPINYCLSKRKNLCLGRSEEAVEIDEAFGTFVASFTADWYKADSLPTIQILLPTTVTIAFGSPRGKMSTPSSRQTNGCPSASDTRSTDVNFTLESQTVLTVPTTKDFYWLRARKQRTIYSKDGISVTIPNLQRTKREEELKKKAMTARRELRFYDDTDINFGEAVMRSRGVVGRARVDIRVTIDNGQK
ncbi:hypothetical protein K440DRAFT_632679 [Wilcoxina mikolae CBS 423.85]|nr:hypothetical protein K440DRAFT_632679 [Wilcoxina mikolae CBS 423.85]